MSGILKCQFDADVINDDDKGENKNNYRIPYLVVLLLNKFDGNYNKI